MIAESLVPGSSPAACSPTDTRGQNMAFGNGGGGAFHSPAPIFDGTGSSLRGASALLPIEAWLVIRPFALRRRSPALQRAPTKPCRRSWPVSLNPSWCLAGLVRLNIQSPHRALRPVGFSLRVARCPARLQNAPVRSVPPLPSRIFRSFGIPAPGSAPIGETYQPELPDLPLLPAAAAITC